MGRSISSCQFFCIFLVSFSRIQPAVLYNLENRLPLFKYGPVDAKFGFSVALHRTTSDASIDERGTMMLAGAPTASYVSWPGSNLTGREPTNPGGVFYCPVSTNPTDCEQIRMDEGGDARVPGTNIISIRSNQWLGASLKSQGPGKFLVTCAHRYGQHVNSGQEQAEVERLCGKCFLLKGSGMDKIVEIPPDSADLPSEFISSPCDLLQKGSLLNTKIRYAYMQAGASLSIEEELYVVGAPGAWAWTGAVFDFKFPEGDNVGNLMYQTPTCYKARREENEHGSWRCSDIPVQRDSYMGMAVATSTKVGTDSSQLFYAAGAPRGNYTGAVAFFRRGVADDGVTRLIPDPTEMVYGEKIGSSFGYSVALTDINNDGLDDLIVGAPQYYEYTNKRKAGGAVYIYLNNARAGFSRITPIAMYGPEDSFFGHSVAALGDIDQDGFNDFAVGAPYEGSSGTVHIYRGGDDGPKESQVIKGSEYPFVNSEFQEIVGFGASLSGSVDADSNKYPDLLIGTFSDSVALLRSRPVITVDATLDAAATEIDLAQKSCSRAGRSHTCFELKFCLSYKARHARYSEGVDIKYNLTLDMVRQDDEKSSRLHYDSPDGPTTISDTVTLPRADFKVCPGETHTIFFENGADDKLTDAKVKFEFDLDIEEVEGEERSAPIYNLINDPILDADSENELISTLIIKNTCGTNGCQSDLKISGVMTEEIIAGDDTVITIFVENKGEEAHQAGLNVYLPPNVDFMEANISQPSPPDMNCYSTISGASSFVICDLGNPYKNGTKDKITLRLSTRRLDPKTKTINVRVEGHTTSENPKIPPVALQSQVIIELSMSISGSAQPEQIRYKERTILGESAMKNTDDIGPLLVYTFYVENKGIQGMPPASGVYVDINLPIEIENGKWLLYLVTSDVEKGGGSLAGICNSTYINTLALEPALAVAASVSSKRRAKRSTDTSHKVIPEAQASSDGGGFVSTVNLACKENNVGCVSIQCDLDDIEPSSVVTITMQLHAWEATFLEELKHVDLVYMKTEARLATRDSYIQFKDGTPSTEVQTTVDHEVFKSDVTSAFPWWLILVGVVVLLVIYIVVIVVLVKCGFFKRKKFRKHENEDEDKSVLVEEEEKKEDRM